MSELFFLKHAQDIEKIMIGSLFENEQGEEPVIVHDEEQLSDVGLQDDDLKNHFLT